MNPQGPQLADIHLPAAPGFWPPAPGWWLLALLLLIAAVFLLRWLRHRLHLARWKTQLRSEFEQVLAATAAPGEEARQVAALSTLLRRAALYFAPRSAHLQGEDWLRFLDGDDPAKPFSEGAGRLLLEGPYQRHVDADAARALAACIGPRLLSFVGARDV